MAVTVAVVAKLAGASRAVTALPALVVFGITRVVDTFTPLWNSLSLFRVPQPHVVSLVAPWAGSARYSITGWFRRD